MQSAEATTGGHRPAAVVVADVVGYSQHLARDEDGTLARLAALRRELAGPAVDSFHGRVVKTLGDGVLAEFADPAEAIACASVVQRGLTEQNNSLPPQERIEVRIGVHYGEIVDVSGDIFGTTVNIAARLESLAEPGSICISSTIYKLVRDRITGTPRDLGGVRLKNIEHEVQAYILHPECVAIDRGQEEATAGTRLRRPSVAVLPFTVVGGGADEAYFGEGIAEDLISALSRFRWFFVISRHSSFAFSGARDDVRRVAVHLGVRYIVDGTIRRQGDRLRIDARLVDCRDGAQIWTDRFDRAAGDIFAVQDEIVEAVAATVEPELQLSELARSHRKRPERLEAQDCVYRAQWHFHLTNKVDNETSRSWYKRAIEQEPTFARAVAGLAYTYYNDAVFGYAADPKPAVAKGCELAQKAIALDPNDAFAHHVLGRLFMLAGKHDASITELRQAIDLNPNQALAHYGLAFSLVMNGQPGQALPLLERAQRLSPRDPLYWAFLTVSSLANQSLGSLPEAEYAARRAVDSPNAAFWAWLQLASTLGLRNKRLEAEAAMAEAFKRRPEFSVAMLDRIFSFREPQPRKKYLEGLRVAGLPSLES